jgi:hypothetical protein
VRRLIVLTLIITSGLTLTIGASCVIGHAQPTRPEVALLHLGDYCALPCWIGITPGKTTFGEALQRINEVYGNLSDFSLTRDEYHYIFSIDGIRFDLNSMNQPDGNAHIDSVLHEINISSTFYHPKLIKAGELFDIFGTPQQLSFEPEDGTVNYFADILFNTLPSFVTIKCPEQQTIRLGNDVIEISLFDQMPAPYYIPPMFSFRGFGREYIDGNP